MSRREVPAAALRLRAPVEFQFADAHEAVPGKAIPVHIVARTDKPVDHWYWGRVVHDLAGMRLTKATIPIDYMHDPREVLGFANRFTTQGELAADGALVPIRPDDRASEVFAKQKAGVPYEASIDFHDSSSLVKIEQLAEGQVAQVNGYTFEGPGTIIREWPLRGIAICPYGIDAATSTQFSAGQSPAFVDQIEKGNAMPEEKPVTPEQPKPEEKPAETQVPPAVPPETKPTDPPKETPPPDASALSAGVDPRAEFKKFAATFGEKAGEYYSAGKTYEQALAQFAADQKTRADELEKRLAAVNRGEKDHLSFSHAAEPHTTRQEQPDATQFASLGGNTAKLAAGMHLSK